jgi:hypothetical protein
MFRLIRGSPLDFVPRIVPQNFSAGNEIYRDFEAGATGGSMAPGFGSYGRAAQRR